jgi:hypothetical protein
MSNVIYKDAIDSIIGDANFELKKKEQAKLVLEYKKLFPKTYIKEWITGMEGAREVMNLFKTRENLRSFLLITGSSESDAEKWTQYICKCSYGHKGFHKKRKYK